ncbi:isomerase [Mycolicibacterium vaccae]|uniref:isomerase n=1 Tax=Mycolicibacterium vaccae TaxID=1810 RepID=UPI003D0790FE
MGYRIDPDVLHGVAQRAAGSNSGTDECVRTAVELLADAYPDLIDRGARRWVGSKAGGILGKVKFLYFGAREYIVIFGSPTGTQGFSGRYKHVDIHKFLLAGRIDSYDLESDETAALPPLLPGGRTCLERGRARGLTIHPGSWHIEYGRGAVLTTLPFAMVDTLVVSLELESVRRSTAEFTRVVRGRFRR